MKKHIIIILAVILSVLTLSLPLAAEELPVYTFDTQMADWGSADISPFSYKYIVKETGAIADMTYAGNENLWNPAIKMYQAGTEYAYCFACADSLHPAANASPAVCFTAPHSGSVTIAYVLYGETTTRLDIFRNEYKAENKLKEQTPNNETTDFEITLDVAKGDNILFTLDCLDDIGSDQTPMWIKSVTYTALTPESDGSSSDSAGGESQNPPTSDSAVFLSCAVFLSASAVTILAVKRKRG